MCRVFKVLIKAHVRFFLIWIVEPNLEKHYNDLLKAISEIGRDVKPAYTNNKVSTDRLRKSMYSVYTLDVRTYTS